MINRIHCLTRIRTGMVLSLLVGFSGTASGITIVNPSFEDVALGSPFFSTNVADVPGWTRSGAAGNGALWRVGYSDALGKVTVAGEGQQFTTLGGGTAGPGITTWSQTIGGFTIGAPYRLDFLMSAECGPDANTPQCQTQSLTATIHQLADVSQVFTETN